MLESGDDRLTATYFPRYRALPEDHENMITSETSQETSSASENSPFRIYVVVLGALSVFIGIAFIVAATTIYACTGGNVPFDYGIVIDAGSTHTQTFLYQWLGSKNNGTGEIFQKGTCTNDDGIATLHEPDSVLDCVNNVTKSMSSKKLPYTPLYLGATAGMRLLNLSDPEISHLILVAFKYALETTEANVKSVDIITGHDEGMFAWITVNYLKKTLGPQKYSWFSNMANGRIAGTYGALDMGGASTQIAFAVEQNADNNDSELSTLTLYGKKYSVFSKSFLCFGATQAFKRHQALLIKDLNTTARIIDPCLPKGNSSAINAELLLGSPCTLTPMFRKWLKVESNRNKNFTFEGSSDFVGCMDNVERLLNVSECEDYGFQDCPSKVNASYVNMEFMAFSSYYYVTSFLNGSNVSLPEFVKITEDWCGITWNDMKKHEYKPMVLSHLTQYCFGAVYLMKWLTEMYGFDENKWGNITFQGKIGDTDIGWSLGYMINATNSLPQEPPTPPVISLVTYIVLLLCSVFVTILGVLLMQQYCKDKCLSLKLKHKRLVES